MRSTGLFRKKIDAVLYSCATLCLKSIAEDELRGKRYSKE